MKRLQQGYGRFLASEFREGTPHTLVLMDPDVLLSAAQLFDAGPGDLVMGPPPPEAPEMEAAFASFLAQALENPRLENVAVLEISRETTPPEVQHIRDRGPRRFSLLRRLPVIQYAQVTRGLRILLLFFSAETGVMETFEHGVWTPFLAEEGREG